MSPKTFLGRVAKNRRADEKRKYCGRRRDNMIARAKKRSARVRPLRKQAILEHYGRQCARCGFSDERALSIDHIEGGGNKHRRIINKSGSGFYEWLIKNNFPDGFQTLCMNCQFIKKHENHEVSLKWGVKPIIAQPGTLPLFD